jgi:hypothetical protein
VPDEIAARTRARLDAGLLDVIDRFCRQSEALEHSG